MPTYKSVNTQVQYYPDLGLLIAPNETVDLADNVDAAGLELTTSKSSKAAPSADASAEGVEA